MSLSKDDIVENFQASFYTQDYHGAEYIDGVKLLNLKSIASEDGDFAEIARLDDKGELINLPGFRLRQINRSNLDAGAIKAWHLHFRQDEIWYGDPGAKLLVGLLDLRKTSPTCGKTMRVVLGGGNLQLLLIPKGVAHGSKNLSNTPAVIWYFIDQQFDLASPDEQRLHWDVIGADFWNPLRD